MQFSNRQLGEPKDFEVVVQEQMTSIPTDFEKDLSKILFAFDIDATLIAPSSPPAPAVLEAIAKLQELKANICIATGRSLIAVLPVLQALGLDNCYAVCSNGAVVIEYDTSLPVHYRIVKKTDFEVKDLVRALLIKYPEGYLGVENIGVNFYVNKEFPPKVLNGKTAVTELQVIEQQVSPRLFLADFTHDPQSFKERFYDDSVKDFEEITEKVNCNVWGTWVDVAAKTITKASGLEYIRNILGISTESTVAVGDGGNDIGMFKWAAYAVAMGLAEEDLVDYADATTEPAEYDGCAAVIQAFIARASS